ncbi:MAG: ACS family MFS transporter [Gammaproteobacteria bacterium]|nr:ACS family MFS transporter [Gammaproteobacteria bacterium]
MTARTAYWPRRYTLIGLCFCATFICYIDRVNISVAIIPMAQEFGWNTETQGIVLSSFFIGYLITQIAGGRLADRYGGKVVLGAGVLLWSLFTILTPSAAYAGFAFLIVCRVAMGLGEAVTFPSVYSLVTRWIPDTERAKAIALNGSGIPLGTVFALLVTPIIVQEYGWEWAFYSFGLAGTVWYAVWWRRVSATPQEHPTISQAERTLIRENAPAHAAAAEKPPWKAFMKSGPVWAILVAHTCGNWSLYVLLAWLPTFVNQGLGVDFAAIGIFSMMPHVASFVFLNIAGNIADRLLKRGMDVTRVRKTMQTIGFSGIAIALLLVTEVESAWAAIAIMSAGNAVGAAGIGGSAINHMDIAPRHAGTLMGITNTAATVPGIVGVYVTGLILESTGSWALVFQTTAGVTIFGMVFYLIFASGEKQFD